MGNEASTAISPFSAEDAQSLQSQYKSSQKDCFLTAMERYSVRSYDSTRPLPEDVIKQINDYISQEDVCTGPFGTKVKLSLLERSKVGGSLGTFKIISGTDVFLVAIIGESADLLEVGYVFEKVILHLTTLGLGTCFMTGTFSGSDFTKGAGCSPTEKVYAISPVGYAKTPEHQVIFEKRLATNHRRLAFSEFCTVDPTVTERPLNLIKALEAARFSPSALNKQPTRIYVTKAAPTEGSDNTEYCVSFAEKSTKPECGVDVGISLLHFMQVIEELTGTKGELSKTQPSITIPSGFTFRVSWKGSLSSQVQQSTDQPPASDSE
ncbi:putative Nitroreductase family protein [Blattamonas nauphoetae]|uniref:Nitroreductase family protein n=1 Tax=Blattamonas nauphoetae TaxID=2049346 RepID=A0ABQ9YHX7_9EUKA|nr:putative Nitroreductase family protein [Blattamonas nauphoetae]